MRAHSGRLATRRCAPVHRTQHASWRDFGLACVFSPPPPPPPPPLCSFVDSKGINLKRVRLLAALVNAPSPPSSSSSSSSAAADGMAPLARHPLSRPRYWCELMLGGSGGLQEGEKDTHTKKNKWQPRAAGAVHSAQLQLQTVAL